MKDSTLESELLDTEPQRPRVIGGCPGRQMTADMKGQ